MQTIVSMTDQEFDRLEARAKLSCVCYEGQALPPGAEPRTARVGFEIDGEGSATMYVDRGVAYGGASDEIRRWLATGRRRFADFAELRAWIRGPLAEAYGDAPCTGPDVPASDPRPGPCGPGSGVSWWPGPEPGALPVIGWDEGIDAAGDVLEQRIEPSLPVVTSPTGGGKSAFVRALATRWLDRPGATRCAQLDAPALLAGCARASDRGPRLARALGELARAGDVLVIIEDLHLLCGALDPRAAGGPAEPRVPVPAWHDPLTGTVLAGLVDRGLRAIATTTPEGLQTIADETLRRRLHVIALAEPDERALRDDLLPAIAESMARRYGVGLAPQAYATAVAASRRLPGAQPGKLIRWLDHALAAARRRKLEVLGPDDVL